MLEAASLLCFYLAFALLHGAQPARFPLKTWQPSRRWIGLMRLSALLAGAAGALLYDLRHGPSDALLIALPALCVMATAFVLLAPICPRLLWGLALACPPLVLVLSILGASDG
jgi:hypothetical protein